MGRRPPGSQQKCSVYQLLRASKRRSSNSSSAKPSCNNNSDNCKSLKTAAIVVGPPNARRSFYSLRSCEFLSKFTRCKCLSIHFQICYPVNYIYIYIYIYIIYIYKYINIYIYIYIYIYICIYIWIYICDTFFRRFRFSSAQTLVSSSSVPASGTLPGGAYIWIYIYIDLYLNICVWHVFLVGFDSRSHWRLRRNQMFLRMAHSLGARARAPQPSRRSFCFGNRDSSQWRPSQTARVPLVCNRMLCI